MSCTALHHGFILTSPTQTVSNFTQLYFIVICWHIPECRSSVLKKSKTKKDKENRYIGKAITMN